MEVPGRWSPEPRRLDGVGWPSPPSEWGVYRADRHMLANAAAAAFLVVAVAARWQ